MKAEEGAGTVIREDAALSVYSYGSGQRIGSPAVLSVHGYPDDHSAFHDAVAELSLDRAVIAYDARNAGQSRVANGRAASYGLPVLVDDLFPCIW